MWLRGFVSLYSWSLPAALTAELETRRFNVWRYLSWFWHARQYPPDSRPASFPAQIAQRLLLLGILAEVAWGIWLLIDWARFGTAGSWQFGLALLVAYPIIWAHVLAIIAALGWLVYFLTHPKKLGRTIVCLVLESQVRRLRKRHEFKIVAVAGSVGKTSTKLAIAGLLQQQLRVQYQQGNYNDRVTVPLVLFGREEPGLLNIPAWLKLFRSNRQLISRAYPYDVVVLELGTDGPGQIARFDYLRPDISVVTAIAPEHMEYFKTLDAVAAEELGVAAFSERLLLNIDDMAAEYLPESYSGYSQAGQADYTVAAEPQGLDGQLLTITLAKGKTLSAQCRYVGGAGAKIVLAAAAAADMLGLSPAKIKKGIAALQPFAGRMQILPGVQNATLIDDTYNASPVAVKSALDTLYAAKAKRRIAILGSMNELGSFSAKAHREVGAYCDSKKLAWVVTIGEVAKKQLAPAAKKAGCQVKSFMSPYEAGEFVKTELKPGAVVLAKGSQNGVFAEEALKTLLANPDDAAKLVRQSPYWLKKKQRQFSRPE